MDNFPEGSRKITEPVTRIAGANSDTVDLAEVCRAINVSTSGNVKVTLIDGTETTVFIAAGVLFQLRAKRIWVTGTAAGTVIGFA